MASQAGWSSAAFSEATLTAFSTQSSQHMNRPPALVAGGVDVQRIACVYGRAQGRRPVPLQSFESPQESVTQHGHGTVGQLAPLADEVGADLAPLAEPVIAGRNGAGR